MTTDASPEKMTNAEIEQGMADAYALAGAASHHHVDTVEMARLAIALHRRLSAPAVPTEGIHWALDQIRIMTQTVDARSQKQHPVVLRIAEVAKKALANSALAPAAPRVGGDDDLLVTLRIGEPWTAADLLERFHVSRLSAPPAPSTDEREELQAILHKLARKTTGEEITNRPEVTLRRWTKKILAAGYRKLASS